MGSNFIGSGGSPGGSDTQIQFNDTGAFGGDAGLTYNKTTNRLTITSGYLSVNGSAATLDVIVKSPTAATPVVVPSGVDPLVLVVAKNLSADAQSQFGVLSTDYSTDPSDGLIIQQDGSGSGTILAGAGTTGAHIVKIVFDPTAGNAMSFTAGAFDFSGPIRGVGGFKSSDGSTGATQDVTTGTLVGKTMSFKNGLLVSFA